MKTFPSHPPLAPPAREEGDRSPVRAPGGIKIVEYTTRDLKALLADEHFWTQPQLPITRRRVISQISNPRADDTDTVLITAHNQGRLLGYVGILPDLLMSTSQATVKFGWLTTWWVDKQSGNRLAATVLLFTAMKRYCNRIAASSPSSDATRVYEATNRFQKCARFERSFFVMALPPSFGVLSSFTRWAVGVKNRLAAGRAPQGHGLESQTVESSNEDLVAFIDARSVGDPLARDGSYWRWILEFPWMSPSAQDEATQRRYAFSVFAKDFRQVPVLVRKHGTVIAFIVMTLRDGRLCLKYAYYDPENVTSVTVALQAAISEINPWLFVSADTALNAELKKGRRFYLARRSKTSEIYGAKGLPLSMGSYAQFGTGDSIFT